MRVRAIHTPGHRPEHTAFALVDTARGSEPWAVLTGDTLFVGDIARPDLAVDREDGARDIFRSLHEKLLRLADSVEVWPGHLGGSLCGGPGMDMKVSSTIGFERRHNELLGEEDEDRFVERATGTLPPQPPNFQAVVDINRGPLMSDAVDAHPLTPRQLEVKQRAGALVVDVRTALQFDEAHVRGSVSNPAAHAGFGTKLAWITDRGQEVVFVGRDARGRRGRRPAGRGGGRDQRRRVPGGRHDELARGAARDGAAWSASTWTACGSSAAQGPGVQILDVREQAEWDAGHIPGSVFRPYHDIDAVPDGIDPVRPIAVICSSGQRSGVAASLLARHGARARAARRGRGSRDLGGPGVAGRGQLTAPLALGSPPGHRRAIFSSVAEVDLNVVCKNCGSEVSPYITECPYCGQRLRKRAPKLRQEGEGVELAPAPQRRRRLRFSRKPRKSRERALSWLSAERPYATITIVLASAALLLAERASDLGLYDLGAIIGPLDGDWWRLAAAQFVYENVGYLFAVGVAAAIFGTSLERRYGTPVMLAVFLASGAAGHVPRVRDRGLPGCDGRQRFRARPAVRVAGPRPARPPRRGRHRDRPVRGRGDRRPPGRDAAARADRRPVGRARGRRGRRRRRPAAATPQLGRNYTWTVTAIRPALPARTAPIRALAGAAATRASSIASARSAGTATSSPPEVIASQSRLRTGSGTASSQSHLWLDPLAVAAAAARERAGFEQVERAVDRRDRARLDLRLDPARERHLVQVAEQAESGHVGHRARPDRQRRGGRVRVQGGHHLRARAHDLGRRRSRAWRRS